MKYVYLRIKTAKDQKNFSDKMHSIIDSKDLYTRYFDHHEVSVLLDPSNFNKPKIIELGFNGNNFIIDYKNLDRGEWPRKAISINEAISIFEKEPC